MTSPSFPRRPNQSPPPEGRKTNRPYTSIHVQCPKAARPGDAPRVSPQLARTRSHYCAHPQRPSRWLRVPGGGAHQSRRPQRRRRTGVREGAIAPKSGPRPQRPLHCCPGSGSPPSCPGWGCGVSSPGFRPCLGAKGSDLVSQQSLLVTATQLKAKAGGLPGQGESAAGTEVARELARGGWPATGAGQ